MFQKEIESLSWTDDDDGCDVWCVIHSCMYRVQLKILEKFKSTLITLIQWRRQSKVNRYITKMWIGKGIIHHGVIPLFLLHPSKYISFFSVKITLLSFSCSRFLFIIIFVCCRATTQPYYKCYSKCLSFVFICTLC